MKFRNGIFSGLLGLALLAGTSVQAGSYVNDFQGYSNGQVQLGGGTTTYLTTEYSANNIVGVFNGGSWQGYRLSQDNTTPIAGQALLQLPDLDPGKAITSFAATFDLLVKNDKGDPADGFSITFGNLNTNLASQEVEKGALASSGSALAVTFITYYGSNPNKYIGARVNTTSVGGNISPAGNVPVHVALTTESGNFRTVNVSYSTTGGLSVTYGGQTVYNHTAIAGFTPQAGYTFGFGARTGGLDEDVFIDNLNITTIPEPGVAGLLALAALGVAARRRRRV